MIKSIFMFSIIVNILIFSSIVKAELKVLYPNVNGAGKELFGYAALKLALDNSGQKYNLSVTKLNLNNKRIRIFLKVNKISIADFGTSVQFEKDFRAIYFPIDFGLNGWRIFLIHKDNQKEFNKITKLTDLRKMVAGQGIGWSDVQILRSAGLQVVESSYIQHLFRMTYAKRFDYFPLGANEAHALLEQYKKDAKDVVVESKILLIYPFGRLFFVNKKNKALHDIIEKGLKKAFNSGEFWKLFKSHKSNRALFQKANLKKRIQFRIDNPNMSDKFKKMPQKYFFNLKMLEK